MLRERTYLNIFTKFQTNSGRCDDALQLIEVNSGVNLVGSKNREGTLHDLLVVLVEQVST